MRRVIQALSAASPLLETASCIRNTIDPQRSGTPEFVRVTEPSSTALGPPESRAASGLPGHVDSAIVTAASGGTVTADRYTLSIPAGALKAVTRVTVRVREEDGIVGCEILPNGIELAMLVRLTMDLAGTSYTAVEPVSIYAYDTSAGEWVDVGATLDSTTLRLWTQLRHFSFFRAGSCSGW